jgi:hypothetical protein
MHHPAAYGGGQEKRRKKKGARKGEKRRRGTGENPRTAGMTISAAFHFLWPADGQRQTGKFLQTTSIEQRTKNSKYTKST